MNQHHQDDDERVREPLLLSHQHHHQQQCNNNDDDIDRTGPSDDDDDDELERQLQQQQPSPVIITASDPSFSSSAVADVNESTSNTATTPANSNANNRLESVDVLRGIVMAVMILVDDAGSACNHIMDHSPWDHIRLADFVMPYFLFIVGVSISLSYSKKRQRHISSQQQGQTPSYLFRHISIRTIRLFVVGFILQGNARGHPFQYNLKTCRIPGILQRISFCYFITAISYLYMPTKSKVPIILQILLPLIPLWSIYLILTYYTPIHHHHHHHHDNNDLNYDKYCPNQTHTDLSIPCNAGRIIDTWIFGGDSTTQHLYQSPVYVRSSHCSTCSPGECLRQDRPEFCDWPYDPEGVLPSIASVGSTILGLPCGNWLQELRSISNDGRSGGGSSGIDYGQWKITIIVIQWMIYGISLCLLGTLIGIPWNKNLYTLTYALFMGGCSVLSLLVCYYWIDEYKCHAWICKPFRWLGMNAIFVFVFGASDVLKYMLTSIYWDNPNNNIVDLTLRFFQFALNNDDAGLICFILVKIIFWIIICRWLYHRKLFFKI